MAIRNTSVLPHTFVLIRKSVGHGNFFSLVYAYYNENLSKKSKSEVLENKTITLLI